MIWQPLEHLLWKQFKEIPAHLNNKLLVGLSGGVDSVALLMALKNLAPQLKYQLSAMYIHHGDNPQDQVQTQYRKMSEEFCRAFCQKHQIDFYVSEKPSVILKSEDELRDFRYSQFSARQSDQILVLAHHIDDLLETRLLRLIRGTGIEGLKAMDFWQSQSSIWRPLIQTSKAQLLEYLKSQNQNYLEDPSNMDSHYLRNWIRNEWLPTLEHKVPGGLKSFSRSLELIANQLNIQNQNKDIDEKITVIKPNSVVSLKRGEYIILSPPHKKQIIAQMLKKAQIMTFSQGQIEEIKKQLDNPQSVHTFSLVSSFWSIDAEQIIVRSDGTKGQRRNHML